MEAPMTNPTETLRAAATKLREMAEAATPGPWFLTTLRGAHPRIWGNGEGGDMADPVTGPCSSYANAALIATLGPTFAVLVADWLDDAATGEDWLDTQLAPGLMPYVPRLPDWTPLALARHVLGEEAPQIAPTQAQERAKPANVGTGEGAPDLGALIGAREVYARGGPLGGSTTVAVSHVGYCARGHDLYAVDGVTQHIITHAETKSGNWAKATCPNVIAGEK